MKNAFSKGSFSGKAANFQGYTILHQEQWRIQKKLYRRIARLVVWFGYNKDAIWSWNDAYRFQMLIEINEWSFYWTPRQQGGGSTISTPNFGEIQFEEHILQLGGSPTR